MESDETQQKLCQKVSGYIRKKKTYMMGLDVKEPLVVLKRPKRGTFLLPWEKLKFKDLVKN